ncbi:histidine kinase [Alloacidobacterium dinghuense]|uniref:Histidine kinase n=1 Tax=Alloacidobacterium dinghuense TaxID=2763107 RepID=A0A7G8BGQ8_9BACT|nr:sensor histidine kinase [Alloacidobacterium dinghuense]QNI31728.1 histidine kinase [Alloacidobacterium dinghuense]
MPARRTLNLSNSYKVFPLLLALTLSAKSVKASDPQPSLRDEVLTTWTTEQGLPQNFITSLAQTSDGFVWVGTMNGLVRFDGLHFRGFGQDGPPELQGFIGGLVRDGGDGLWIVTASSFFHYEHHRFVPILFEGRPHYRIDAIARSKDGELWVCFEGRLERTQAGRLVPARLPDGVHRVSDLAIGNDGSLWIADGENIFRMRKDSVVAKYNLRDSRFLYSDRFGDLWAGDGHRLFHFDGNGFTRVNKPGLGNFVSVMVDSHHRLWMASGGLHGLTRKSGDEVETLTQANGLASNDVRTILEDHNGDFWLGTIAGLQRLHQGIFTSYSVTNRVAGQHTQTVSIFEQRDGSIWTGTLEGGVVRWWEGHSHRFDKAQGLSPGQVRGFFEHGAAPAIAIADYGIFEKRGSRFAKMTRIPHGYVSTPVVDGVGSVWFRIEHVGIFRFRNGEVAEFGTKDGLSGKPVSWLGLDPRGDLWVGDAAGMERWNGSRFERGFSTDGPVLCAAWPRDGLAICTFNGLLLRSETNGRQRLLTQKEGLPGNTVLDVMSDDAENLWIVTASAIARIVHEQWKAYAEGRSSRIDPEVFTEADGLKSRYVLPLNGVTAIRAHDGRMWFATIKGPAVIDPHLMATQPAQAVLDSIVVDDQHNLSGDLIIGPGRHRITFAYTAPATVAPEQTHFRYRLVGWDRDWVDAGTSREVSYTGLRPAHYAFQVMATNREGGSSGQPAQVEIQIRPFFWQTKWFLIVVICAAIGIIVEVTRRFTRRRAERLSMRFQERVAERERIAHEIHDTVIQDLIGATLQLELIGFEIADQPGKSKASLATLAGRMRETIARSRNMVSNLHSTAVTQYSLVEVLRHSEAEFRSGPLPVFDLVSQGEPREVQPLIRDEVYRICREALANAFRHAHAEYVTVEVRFLPDMLEVEIADDGNGMTEDLLQHGRTGHFGLRGMHAHAQRIGATLVIESEPEQGTNVILRVKTSSSSLWRRNGRGRFRGNDADAS